MVFRGSRDSLLWDPAAKTESFFSKRRLAQEGHSGITPWRTRSSKLLQHFLQAYSNNGIMCCILCQRPALVNRRGQGNQSGKASSISLRKRGR